MIGIGFIGVGGMGRHQALAFAQIKKCRVIAGADLAEESRRLFAEQHAGAAVYADYHALLADPKVDAVVISLPTGLHLDAVNAALALKKPVLCEKPLGRTVAQCRKMIEASKKHDTLLMVAHCRRFDTYWGAMRKIVESGALGRPLLWRHIAAGFGPAAPWFMDDALGGGPLLDGAVHNHDFANLVFGDPVAVTASSIDLTGSSAVNTASAIVQYAQGDQMLLSWSWGVAPSGAGALDILGPEGSLLFAPGASDSPDLDKQKYGYYQLTSRKNGKAKLVRYPLQDMYVNQAKHFLDCLQGKTECLSPATEAIKAVAVAEALFASAKKQGKPVNVRW